MSLFIGIDIGASFVKGALLDTKKVEIRDIKKLPTPAPSQSSNRFEVDANKYLASVKKILNSYLSYAHIDGIVLSSQMHGMVLTDSNLNPITKFIGWQDERSLDLMSNSRLTYLDSIKQKLVKVNHSGTGISLRPGIMVTTLFWLSKNKVLDTNKNCVAQFLGDYIASRLTGSQPIVEASQACGSGCFDVSTGSWHKKVLDTLNLSEHNLPRIVKTGTPVGNLKYGTKTIPVYVSTGDLQTAVLGSLIGLENKREILINIGTGSQVSYVSDKFIPGDHDIRSFFDKRFLNTVTFLPAGRALNVIIAMVKDIGTKIFDTEADIWEKINRLTKKLTNSQGITTRASFYENNASSEKTGEISGITERNLTIANIFLSVVLNMAQNYYSAYLRLVRPKATDRILISGGLGRGLTSLQDAISDRFKRKVNIARYAEETLVGLLILSLFCEERYSTVQSAAIFVNKHGVKVKKQKTQSHD